ncbi:hypothetical protein EW146_g8166 [Bondarzewia mesenterica]|nr:hypothetical protein EW146_g8166 [Bondarzewia mesenterica]
MQVLLATQLNHLVEENLIGKNTIAQLEKFSCNVIQGKRLVVILSLRVVQKEAAKIGNPTVFGPDRTAGQAQAQADISAPPTELQQPTQYPVSYTSFSKISVETMSVEIQHHLFHLLNSILNAIEWGLGQ